MNAAVIIPATVPRWTYSDSDPKEAMMLAFSSGLGPTPEARMRGLRALMVGTAYLIDELQLDPTPMTKAAEGVDPGPAPAPPAPRVFGLKAKPVFPTTQYKEIAATLGRTFLLLPPAGKYTVYSVTTRDGEPPVIYEKGDAKRDVTLPANDTDDTGLAPMVGVVIVACVGVLTWGMVTVAQQYQSTVDKWLVGREATTRILTAQQRAVEVVAGHLERDQKSGTITPFAKEELDLVDALKAAQEKAIEQERKLAPPTAQRPKGLLDVLNELAERLPYIAAAGMTIYAITR